MKIEILLSCMHQTDGALLQETGITGDAVVVNQCDREEYREYPTVHGIARMYDTSTRGLTRSRNLAIEMSDADICMLCDDDELFAENYEAIIRDAYIGLPDADVIAFRLNNWPTSLPERTMRLRFPWTMKISSCQISFRRARLLNAGVRFDELLGAGSGNGAEEELKFLRDCERAGLRIYYVPTAFVSLRPSESTWFDGFTEQFFYNRGATTRYILGLPLATAYAIYYAAAKSRAHRFQISSGRALLTMLRGMMDNRISKAARQQRLEAKKRL